MKRLILILGAIGASSFSASAMWAHIPLDELVQDSDLIVVGTLEGVSQYSDNGMDHAQGTILIDEVIWGAANGGEVLILKWQNLTGLVCPRVAHEYNQAKKGIWLLTVEDDGVVRANYPGRFVCLTDRKKVERILERKKVCLRSPKFAFGAEEPVNISLVLRNPTENPIEFPGFQSNDGFLVMDPDIGLALCSGYGDKATTMSPLPNRAVLSETLPTILVRSHGEFRVSIDLRKLFDLTAERNYYLRLTIKGFAPANSVGVYLDRNVSGKVSKKRSAGKKTSRSVETLRLGLLFPSLVAAAAAASILAYRRRRRT